MYTMYLDSLVRKIGLAFEEIAICDVSNENAETVIKTQTYLTEESKLYHDCDDMRVEDFRVECENLKRLVVIVNEIDYNRVFGK